MKSNNKYLDNNFVTKDKDIKTNRSYYDEYEFSCEQNERICPICNCRLISIDSYVTANEQTTIYDSQYYCTNKNCSYDNLDKADYLKEENIYENMDVEEALDKLFNL